MLQFRPNGQKTDMFRSSLGCSCCARHGLLATGCDLNMCGCHIALSSEGFTMLNRGFTLLKHAVSAVFSQICQKRQLLTPSEGDQRTHPARPTAPMPPVCYWVGVVYYFGWVCFLVGLKAQRHQRPTMNVVSWLSCDAVHADTTCCCSVTWLSYCI